MVTPTAAPGEREDNEQSIKAAAAGGALTEGGPAYALLMTMAAAGEDVQCYTPAGVGWEYGNVWIGPLADATAPTRNGRVELSVWRDRWRWFIAYIADHLAENGRPDLAKQLDAIVERAGGAPRRAGERARA